MVPVPAMLKFQVLADRCVGVPVSCRRSKLPGLQREPGDVTAVGISVSHPRSTRLFVSAFLWSNIALGLVAFASALLAWHSADLLRFASFLGAALVASVLKIRLPGVTGAASVSALFILIGIVD